MSDGKRRLGLGKTLSALAVLFVVAFTVYSVTGQGHPTDYNYYVRLADALLHGRLYVLDHPSWLNELIPTPMVSAGMSFIHRCPRSL